MQPLFSDADLQLYLGISYRHCLVKRNGSTGTVLTPPHDITGKPIAGHLPAGRYGARLLELMKASADLLENHPVNLARKARGENPANSVWFWGEGTKPKLDPLEQLYGVRGGVVCAVDLIKGLGLCAGMRTVDVPGATGGMVTNYRGKAEAALRLLHDGCDLVYIHIEAPDECGHHGDAAAKVRAIEEIDRNILGWLMEQLDREGEAYRILLTPDHPTPVSLMTHTDEPVPFVLYDSTAPTPDSGRRYSEAAAKAAGLFLPEECFADETSARPRIKRRTSLQTDSETFQTTKSRRSPAAALKIKAVGHAVGFLSPFNQHANTERSRLCDCSVFPIYVLVRAGRGRLLQAARRFRDQGLCGTDHLPQLFKIAL